MTPWGEPSGPWGRARGMWRLDEFGAVVAEVRAWLGAGVYRDCGVLDDVRTVVSELLGNCVRSGPSETDVTLITTHAPREVRGTLIHHAPPKGRPVRNEVADEQTAGLLDGVVPKVTDLVTGGRGLLVVESLTDDLTVTQNVAMSMWMWRMPLEGCVCETRRMGAVR